jgi:putative addiction module CopG family antidote
VLGAGEIPVSLLELFAPDMGWMCHATPEFVAWTAEVSYSDSMNVDLTPEQKAFAQRAIESGRLNSEDDAVRQALALWEERERQRAEFLQTLSEAKASAARGEGRDVTPDTIQQLAVEVKERGRARLMAELNASR